MTPIYRSATFVALLTFASGCMDSTGEGPKLIPYQTERGFISYRTEDETQEPASEAATSSGYVPVQQPQFVAGNGRGDEQARREILEYHRNRQDRITQDRQARQDAQALQDRAQSLQREQARMEQQARRDQEHHRISQRRLMAEQAARDQAARQQRQDEAQARWLQQQSAMQFLQNR